MDSFVDSAVVYIAGAVIAIAIPILLVELYAAAKGKDRRLWSWRALFFGPIVASLFLAGQKKSERRFRSCPTCGKPVRRDSASCPFCKAVSVPDAL
jgi:hypothetical protein